MTKKPKHPAWPSLTIPCPHELERDILLYWDDVLKTVKGHHRHPDDAINDKRYRDAIKVLLEFFT